MPSFAGRARRAAKIAIRAKAAYIIKAILLTFAISFYSIPQGFAQWPADKVTPAAEGDLDPTFGGAGKVTTDFAGFEDDLHAVLIQPDGKIVAGGFGWGQSVSGFGLVRYNADGSLDTSFGNAGKVVMSMSPGLASDVSAMALQPDGKIIAVGVGWPVVFTSFDFLVARYNADGTLDTGFGDGGKLFTDFFGFEDRGVSIAVQPDGRILVAGPVSHSDDDSSADFGIARYKANGSLDTSFGDGGKVAIDFDGKENLARSVIIQPDLKIIIAGIASYPAPFVVGLARLNSDGTLDTSFGNSGKATATAAGGGMQIKSAALQSDGKIVCAGDMLTNPQQFALCRFNADGSLDTGFGVGGFVTTGFANQKDYCQTVLIQSDDKILAGGTTFLDTVVRWANFALARFNDDGGLDTSFGDGGKLTTAFFGKFDAMTGLALQSDGKIIAAGSAAKGDANNSLDFALARYISTVSASFGLSFDQPSMTAQRGTKAKIRVNILRHGGFTGNVTVTFPDLSAIGIKPKGENPVTTAGDRVVFKAKIGGSAPTGPQPITFTATDSQGRTRTATMILIVE